MVIEIEKIATDTIISTRVNPVREVVRFLLCRLDFFSNGVNPRFFISTSGKRGRSIKIWFADSDLSCVGDFYTTGVGISV